MRARNDTDPSIPLMWAKLACAALLAGRAGALPLVNLFNPHASSQTWQLVEEASGQTFFDHWNFFTGPDPTQGTVIFQDGPSASQAGLTSINSQGHAVLKVDTTSSVVAQGGRASVRIQSNTRFTGGLLVMDAVHMPTGCGTWPAWWTLNDDWPYGGEIDILEGMNAHTQNIMSIHTGDGCFLESTINQSQKGTFIDPWSNSSSSCSALNNGNGHCGVLDSSSNNGYGSAFNQNQGGIYALLWTSSRIEIYFFPRGGIPLDLKHNMPKPSEWGKPMANFTSPSCSPSQFFYHHFAVFDTTLCGTWAGGGAWTSPGPGGGPSCAQSTGFATCQDYVLQHGQGFTEAYWEIASVKWFNLTTVS